MTAGISRSSQATRYANWSWVRGKIVREVRLGQFTAEICAIRAEIHRKNRAPKGYSVARLHQTLGNANQGLADYSNP
jgi:hypothetical protein